MHSCCIEHVCSLFPTWLDLREIMAWITVELSLACFRSVQYWQETILVKWLTNSCDGTEHLWMKCCVCCLCLRYLSFCLSGQHCLGQTDDVTIHQSGPQSKSIVRLPPVVRSNVFAAKLVCWCFCQTVWHKQHFSLNNISDKACYNKSQNYFIQHNQLSTAWGLVTVLCPTLS